MAADKWACADSRRWGQVQVVGARWWGQGGGGWDNRKNVRRNDHEADYVHSDTLGLTRLPSGKLKIADKTFKYSKFCSMLSAPDWREQCTSTIANNSYQSKRHVDSTNSKQSMMLGLGSYRIYGNADCKKLLAVCPWLTTGASARLTAKSRKLY